MSDPLHIACPKCDSLNRVPAARLGDSPKCGKCSAKLFEARPVELTSAGFEKHIKGDIPILVDFWAPWCGPCRMMAPQFEKAAGILEPKVRLVKVNTDAEPGLGGRYDIRSIPTLVLFKNGKEVARQPGAMDAAGITRWASANLGGG